MTAIKTWIGENQALAAFIIGQTLAVGAAAAAILAYAVRLEVRVSIMETRGAEYTVARMEEMKQRITILEQQNRKNEAQLERIVTLLTRDVGKPH
jgi:ERCC4-type nuclease